MLGLLPHAARCAHLHTGWGPGPTNGDDAASAKMDAASGLISSDSRFEVEVKLADLQADPNSPLYSVKTFEELPM